MRQEIQRYGKWAPTCFDHRGAFLGERHEWLVGLMRTRDSGPLEESNFNAALEMLGGESETVEVHRFGHWGPGWLEIILVAPDTPQAEMLEYIFAQMSDYPVLDEEDLSAREFEDACEAWESLSISERMGVCARHGVSVFAARRNSIPEGLHHWNDFYQPE